MHHECDVRHDPKTNLKEKPQENDGVDTEKCAEASMRHVCVLVSDVDVNQNTEYTW